MLPPRVLLEREREGERVCDRPGHTGVITYNPVACEKLSLSQKDMENVARVKDIRLSVLSLLMSTDER